ncbi:MAG: hypothetical protein QOH21_3271 [Acidobacteriota bacterium]|jgi:hypothetical protein|nr:hypothetical protein [Acidobacteriota bacterium]
MKTIALLGSILLVLASCSSSQSIVDEQTFDCGSGQALDIQAGLQMAQMRSRGTDFGGDRATLIVNVFNNSHNEITIKNVSADQISDPQATYSFDRGNLNVDVTIADGEEHTFEIPMTARGVGSPDVTSRSSSGRSPEIVMAVRVTLSTGDSYRCRYSVGSPL